MIIWPGNITEKTCVRLINSRRTWMTARRGDAALMTHEGETERQYIDSVELYRVFPAEHNGETVESAWAWLDEVNPERERR